jgi:hypothetical protein
VLFYSDFSKKINAMPDNAMPDGDKKKEYVLRLEPFSQGKANEAPGFFTVQATEAPFSFLPLFPSEDYRHYFIDLKGDVFFAEQEDGGLLEVNAEERFEFEGLQDGNSAPIYRVHHSENILEKLDEITHEAQTAEKVEKMRFFTSLYSFKRDTKLAGCYLFMKPYAIAWAAGVMFGTYKLFKKLGIYERFLKPNTHGLKEDALDSMREA